MHAMRKDRVRPANQLRPSHCPSSQARSIPSSSHADRTQKAATKSSPDPPPSSRSNPTLLPPHRFHPILNTLSNHIAPHGAPFSTPRDLSTQSGRAPSPPRIVVLPDPDCLPAWDGKRTDALRGEEGEKGRRAACGDWVSQNRAAGAPADCPGARCPGSVDTVDGGRQEAEGRRRERGKGERGDRRLLSARGDPNLVFEGVYEPLRAIAHPHCPPCLNTSDGPRPVSTPLPCSRRTWLLEGIADDVCAYS